jgi:hypothetical protein
MEIHDDQGMLGLKLGTSLPMTDFGSASTLEIGFATIRRYVGSL